MLKKLAELLNVYAFFVALLTVLINKNALNSFKVVSQVHSQSRAGLTVASKEATEGFQERSHIKVGRFFICFFLFVKTTLLLKSGDGSIDLLCLLLGGKSTFFGSSRTIVAIFAPICEVTISFSNVVLGKTEYF